MCRKCFYKIIIKSITSYLLLFLFSFCNKDSTSPNSISQKKLDCSKPSEVSGSNGSIVEVFNDQEVCKYFEEYPNVLLQTIPWNGQDNDGNSVESGWYTVKVSVFSNGIGSVQCMKIYVDNETSPPGAPKNIAASPGDRQLIVHWDMVPKAVNYFIYYSEGEQLVNRPDSIRTGMTNDTIITGLKNGSYYSLAIKARNSGGVSAASDTIHAYLPVVIPTMPLQLSVVNGHKSISLSWLKVDGADTYEAYCVKGTSLTIKPGDSLKNDGIQTVLLTSPPALFTDLIDCEEYTVGVSARNSAGISSLNSIAAKPELSNPSIIWNQQIDQSVFIHWKAINGAKLYRCIVGKAIFEETDSLVFDSVQSPLELQGLIRNIACQAKVYSIDSLNASCCTKTTYYRFTPLSPPTGFSVTPKCRRVEFSWDKSDGIGLYRVYFAKGNSVSLTDTFASFYDISEKTITRLNNGTTYTFAVASLLGESTTDTSISPFSQSMTTTPAPTPPDSLIIHSDDSLAIIKAKYVKPYDSALIDSVAIYYNAGTVIDTLGKPFISLKFSCTIPSLTPNTWYTFVAKSYVSGYSSIVSKPYQVFTASIKNFTLFDTLNGPTHMIIFQWDTISVATGYIVSYYSPDAANPGWTSYFKAAGTYSKAREEFYNSDRHRYYGFIQAVYTGGYSVCTDTLFWEP